MNTLILFVALLLVPIPTDVDTPDWVRGHGKSKSHPENSFLVGYGMAKKSQEDDRAMGLQVATENAKRNLVEKVRVTIQNTVLSINEERDSLYSSYFSTATQSTSSLEIQGLETETYCPDAAEFCHALVFISRDKLAQSYRAKAVELRKEIQAHLVDGEEHEKANDRTKSLEEYLACYALFRQLEEAETIVTAAHAAGSTGYSEFETSLKGDELSLSHVRHAVERVVQKPLLTVQDVAWYLVYCLKNQVTDDIRSVVVTPFTYQDTRMGSAFSRFFAETVQSKVIEVAKWEVAKPRTDVRPRSGDIAREFAAASGAGYVLGGTYWQQSTTVRFMAILRRVSDGRIVSSAEAQTPIDLVEATHLTFEPQNFKRAKSDQEHFMKNEVVGGGLTLDFWTNKGTENLIYAKGERMHVYVRVNMPCHIRFIDHLPDAKRVLQVNDLTIDESKVNKVYRLPQEFECDEPYGVETLQMFARTESFEPIETVKLGGYDVIKEDLGKLLATTRGMKKVSPGTMQAERRLVITTIEGK